MLLHEWSYSILMLLVKLKSYSAGTSYSKERIYSSCLPYCPLFFHFSCSETFSSHQARSSDTAAYWGEFRHWSDCTATEMTKTEVVCQACWRVVFCFCQRGWRCTHGLMACSWLQGDVRNNLNFYEYPKLIHSPFAGKIAKENKFSLCALGFVLTAQGHPDSKRS